MNRVAVVSFKSPPSFLALAFGLTSLFGCQSQDSDESSLQSLAQRNRELDACNIDKADVEPDSHLHACRPGDEKKTTICHIPPGNPSNAHTLCVGNPAVPAHMKHGDYMGSCKAETACPSPDDRDGELAACNIEKDAVEPDANLHACGSNDKKKTSVCHIPPGNPSNAHTLCVGTAAVAAHVRHGDTVGACKVESLCPMPNSSGGSSGSGSGGSSGTGSGGASGSGSGGTMSGSQPPVPMCKPLGASCTSNADCCQNFCAADNTCGQVVL